MRLIFLVARRFLFTKNSLNLTNIISFIGIFVGSFSLIVSISVLNGFQNLLSNEISKVFGNYSVDNFDISSDKNIIHFLDQNNLLYNQSNSEKVFVESQLSQFVVELKSVEERSLTSFYNLDIINQISSYDENTLLIGDQLAFRLGVNVGDKLKIYNQQISVSNLVIPTYDEIMVTGIFSNKVLKANSSIIFKTFKNELKNINHLEILGDFNQDIFPEKILSWKEKNRQLFEATELEKLITFISLLLIIIISSFSLSATIIQIISNKTKSITILRVLGLSQSGFNRIFFIYGYLISVISVFCGMVISCLIIFLQNSFGLIKIEKSIYFVDTLPMAISMKEILIIFLVSLLLIGIFILFPLKSLKRFKIIKTLQNN
jgi:lipoprotein-releasing system permease protein